MKSRRKTSRKGSKRRRVKLVYIGKFRKPSSRKWFKHDIYFRDNNRFIGLSFGEDVVKNDRDDDGNYEDPISGDVIKDGDEVVCLGDNKSYWCYTLETIQGQLKAGKPEDPMTRRPIDPSIVKAILVRDFPILEDKTNQAIAELLEEIKRRISLLRHDPDRHGEEVSMSQIISQMFDNSLYSIERDEDDDEYIYMKIKDNFNDDPAIIFDRDDIHNTDILAIYFGKNFNQSLDGIEFPESVIKIVFGRDFNQPIEKVEWPADLRELRFGKRFNQPIDDIMWSLKLQIIEFGEDFNQSIEDVEWPKNFTRIIFGKRFNQPIDKVKWPEDMDAIIFDEDFNQPIDKVKWPKEISRIYFGDGFNQPIKDIKWPNSITELQFLDGFNQSIKGMILPKNLRHLYFGRKFNQPFEGVVFNKKLKEIFLPESYNQPRNVIPSYVSIEEGE